MGGGVEAIGQARSRPDRAQVDMPSPSRFQKRN